MFEANAKLPKAVGLVSTLLHFPRINFIHLHCSYQKGKATACCCLHWKYYMPKGSALKTVFFLMLESLHDHYAVDLKTYRE